MNNVIKALSDLRAGKFILVHDFDDRESETDLVTASQFVTLKSVQRLRVDGGGLICVTLHEAIYEKLGIPFMTEIYSSLKYKYNVLNELEANDIPYDAKSAFSITINHRKTFTGITDKDRALTISELGKFCGNIKDLNSSEAQKAFGKLFRSPGHVHLLNAAKGLLDKRQGHTELTTALMMMAGLTPSATICEMMYTDGNARPYEEAVKYAKINGIITLTGQDIIDEWNRRKTDG